MSVLQEFTRLKDPQPGPIERRGNQLAAPIVFGERVLWLEGREEVLRLVQAASVQLARMDAITDRQGKHAQEPKPLYRPYVPEPEEPAGQEATQRPEEPLRARAAASAGQVVPDPPQPAAAP
jgi:hypothetical protein